MLLGRVQRSSGDCDSEGRDKTFPLLFDRLRSFYVVLGLMTLRHEEEDDVTRLKRGDLACSGCLGDTPCYSVEKRAPGFARKVLIYQDGMAYPIRLRKLSPQ